MKQIEFSTVGAPQDVVRYANVEAPWEIPVPARFWSKC